MRISDWSSDVCSSDLFNTGGLDHTFVIGASITKEDYDMTQGNVQRFADGTAPAYDPISIADPQGVYTGPVNFIASSIQAGSLTHTAVYAFDQVKFGGQYEIGSGACRDKVWRQVKISEG